MTTTFNFDKQEVKKFETREEAEAHCKANPGTEVIERSGNSRAARARRRS